MLWTVWAPRADLAMLGPLAGALVIAFGLSSAATGKRRLAFLVAVLGIGLAIFAGLYSRTWTPDREQIGRAHQQMWQQLDGLAESLAADLSRHLPAADRQTLFERLRVLLEQSDPAAIGVLLLDADGEAAAWYGAGLLHEPAAFELPQEGRAFYRSYTAVTALAVRPIAGASRPWRVVVGRSFTHQVFPFADLEVSPAWSMAGEDAETEPAVWRIEAPGGPALYLDPRIAEPAAEGVAAVAAPAAGWRRSSLLLVAIASTVAGLVLLARRRRLGAGGLSDPAVGLGAAAAWIAGGVGLAAACGAAEATLGVVAAAFAIAMLDLSPAGRRWLPTLQVATIFAAAVAILVTAQQRLSSSALWREPDADAIWICIAMAVAMLGQLVSVPQQVGEKMSSDRWLAIAASALLIGAVIHDHPRLAVAAGMCGAGAAAMWWGGLTGPRLRPSRFVGLVVLAALATGLAWQTAHRWVVRQRLENQVLPSLAPPSADELNELLIDLHTFFDGYELRQVMPPPRTLVPDAGDLPYALWRGSPLPLRDGLSAVVVESAEGRRFLFSFGLAFGAGFEPLPSPARWPLPEVPVWQESLVQGDGVLLLGGRPWGRVHYWFMPRPGFRRAVDERKELERNLVRGKPRSETADGLPAEARYALFDPDGKALLSPWDEAPPLAAEVAAGGVCGRQSTPEGSAWCWARLGADGVEVLFLPMLGPQSALERVGVVAMAIFPALLLLGALALVGAAPRDTIGQLWSDSSRSYSRRLVLVFTLLLLLPLIALNLVLLRSAAERLRSEQLSAARDAMVSARTLLLDYLRGLEPGFLIETQVHRELLEWIGGLVGHQVNLYWGSRLYASSQQEMFTAGLLPSRIPGEVYTRLSLLGYDLGFRRQQTGDLAYLEVYTPIDVPGIVSSQQGLFLSVPLLEQEEDAARELSVMKRRALLVTSALLLITLAVAGRLSRRFTEPIVQLIEGTRRIARGQTYKPVEPRETELRALAAAIGEMAEQVAASRRGLELEKHFIERVVANITSAVVSLDRGHRVVLQNRLAGQLLGTDTGEAIDEALARDSLLEPVREFVASAVGSDEPIQRQVKLRPRGERVEVLEWSLTWVPIPGDEDPAALLVVDDATEVLRGQRLEAWAEMARIIAHEIKNPLTPIQLSTEHLQQVYKVDRDRFGEVLDRCSANILRNVAELREIASEFSTYSRIPAADLRVDDLVAAMSELAANYRDAPRAGIAVEFLCSLERLEVLFDRRLLGRAVRNLMENAVRAVAPAGGRVVLEVGSDSEWASVLVADSGPGVEPEKLGRIFEPYFSTYDTGTGLGLAITRRIVEEHGGEIEARNRPGGGLGVVIKLPLTMEKPPGTGIGQEIGS